MLQLSHRRSVFLLKTLTQMKDEKPTMKDEMATPPAREGVSTPTVPPLPDNADAARAQTRQAAAAFLQSVGAPATEAAVDEYLTLQQDCAGIGAPA